jgi:hypothetical protein
VIVPTTRNVITHLRINKNGDSGLVENGAS